MARAEVRRAATMRKTQTHGNLSKTNTHASLGSMKKVTVPPIATSLARGKSSGALLTGRQTARGASVATLKGDAAATIILAGAKPKHNCNGSYTLVVGRRVNGLPLWEKQEGAHRFLYNTPNGFWRVTDSESDFETGQGWLRSAEEHQGLPPSEVVMWKESGREPSSDITCVALAAKTPRLPPPQTPRWFCDEFASAAAAAALIAASSVSVQWVPEPCLVEAVERAGVSTEYAAALAERGLDRAQAVKEATTEEVEAAGIPRGHAVALRVECGAEIPPEEDSESEEEEEPKEPEPCPEDLVLKARLFDAKLRACDAAMAAARIERKAWLEQQTTGALRPESAHAVWKARLRALFAAHDPQKLSTVEQLSVQCGDNLPELVQSVKARFEPLDQAIPTTLFISGAGELSGRYQLREAAPVLFESFVEAEKGVASLMWTGTSADLRSTPGGRWMIGETLRSARHWNHQLPIEAGEWQLLSSDGNAWRPVGGVQVSTRPNAAVPLTTPLGSITHLDPLVAPSSDSDASPQKAEEESQSVVEEEESPQAVPLAPGVGGCESPPECSKSSASDGEATLPHDARQSSSATSAISPAEPLSPYSVEVLELLASGGWRTETVNKSGTKVMWDKKKVDGCSFDANKFTVDVNCSMQEFLRLMADPQNMKKYDKNVDVIEVVERPAETDVVLYLTMKMPPLDKRDVLSQGSAAILTDEEAQRYRIASPEDTRRMESSRTPSTPFSRSPAAGYPGCFVLASQSLPEHAKKPGKVKGYVRAVSKAVCIAALPLSGKSIRLSYMLCVDPGGKVPAWAMNKAGKMQMENLLRMKCLLDGTKIKGI
eukprot:Hpha_TRINITY_DN12475_c0_g1::TRINITY_DN12475_c0_g1_i1::g.42927::m.42927